MEDEGHIVNVDIPFYMDDIDLDNPVMDGMTIPTDEEYGEMIEEEKPELDDVDEEYFDNYINAEIMVNHGGEQVKAHVAKHARSDDGKPIGQHNANPWLDTHEYECITEDGQVECYTANIIAENIFSQVDSEGMQMLVLKEIVDHKKDNLVVNIEDGYTMMKSSHQAPKITTRGWKFLVEWKDGTTDWIALKDLKDSNLIELAEYAVANHIQEEPALKWWVG